MPCTVVDLPPTDNLATQLSLLSAELQAEPCNSVLAWRRVDDRWTRFTRQIATKPTTDQAKRTHLRHGAYLITGGASGIGAAVARSLAEQGIPLILTGRTPLLRAPARAAFVAALRKRGATVDYLVADVTQADEVTALFDYIEQIYGAPAGVIHAAGIVQPQPLRSKTHADFQAVVAPKIVGAWLLAQELQRRAIQPDCFVLFSSIASVVPGLSGGLSDYTAANAFLDALAMAERRRGIACTVLNWAAWAETGMGAQPRLLQRLADHGLAGIRSEEGVRAFYRALSLDTDQVVILKPSADSDSSNEWIDEAITPPTRHAPPATLPISAATESERTLQTLLATVLKVEPETLSTQASFLSLGIDSMDALDLVLKLEAAGFRGLPATLFFEYQTIADLARHLADQPQSPSSEPSHLRAANPVVSASFPLSPTQRAFAINQYLYPTRPAVAFLRQTLRGELQLEPLQRAVDEVAARHPLLRARFSITDIGTQTPQQTIYPVDEPGILPQIEQAEPVDETALARLETAIVNHPFDLTDGSPWRIALAADDSQPNCWHLLLTIHHIAGDAWSLSLLAHELWTIYTALVHDRVPDLPLPQGTFQAYVAAQQACDTATQLWWQQQITNYAPALPIRLPFDRDPDQFTPEEWEVMQQAAHATRLTPHLTAALTQLAAQHDLSLFHLLLAAYLRALQRWSDLPYLIVNVADAQRPTQPPGMMQVVGSFADTLPLGLALEPNETVFALGQRIRQAWVAIQHHKSISSLDLTRLLAEVVPNIVSAQPRMFSPVGFSFARFAVTPPVDCPVEVIDLFGRTATAAMRLSLVGWEFNGALGFAWNYLTPLFHPETVAALAASFVRELEALVAVAQPITLSTAFVPVHAQVQAQCRRTPDAVVVWDHGTTLTYGELDQQSDRVAAALCAQGMTADDSVGLLAEPSAEAIILLLGIAKANAAWVPLDPAHPPARHADQLGQAQVRILIFPAALTERAKAIHAALGGAIQLLSLATLCQALVDAPPPLIVASARIAYIIFTSGSTGRPKGVPIPHGALANYIGWAVDTFGYNSTDRVMQATALCFDASIRQILAPLVTGGTVIPVERSTVNDPDALLQFVQQARITVWSSAPALWGRLLGAIEKCVATGAPPPALPHLRWLQVGGEALSAHLVRRWFDLYGDGYGSQQQLVNLYGPTETTINATYYVVTHCPSADEVQMPIGYPIRGAHLQVLDAAGLPCPIGTPGELGIGGVSLSPGYLNDDAQTSQRFVMDATGQRAYRTGDRVQQRADGALLFLGRLDEQVKVRGYRIELGEIEAVLMQHPAIRLSAVLTRQRTTDQPANEQAIVAYLECRDVPPEELALRQWLRNRLPDYMLPHHFYQQDRLPLTPNGKIDRHALAADSPKTMLLPRVQTQAMPQTPTEQLLLQIWQKILGTPTTARAIGRNDDFFALGGDSLQAIRVFAELEKQRDVLPRATYLYRYRTLATLAQALDDYRPTTQPPTSAATGDHFGITLAQAGFLLLHAGRADQATSWCARFALEGALDVARFAQAVQLLVARHLMLRVVFPATDTARIRQQRELPADQPLPVSFEDLQSLPDAAAQQIALAERWGRLQSRRFDPTQWPLIEMHICRVTPTQHLWFVATDHLIGDGWSGWLLGQELLQLYDALVQGQPTPLSPLRSNFRDYVTLHQQHERASDPAAEHYWRTRFATPYQPPLLRQGTGAEEAAWVHHTLDFDARLVERLEAYAAAQNVTPYELLLTLFLYQLRQLTGQADLVVGSALAGRDEPLPDIMCIFGTFATALPLRIQLADDNWHAQVQQVAHAFGEARAHTLSPRRIAHLLPPQTAVAAAIGTQFLFSYMDFTVLGELHSATLRVRWEDSQTELQPPGVGTDLVLTARKLAGQLRLFFTCSSQVLAAQQLQQFARGFQQALHQQIEPPAPAAIHFTNRPLEEEQDTQPRSHLDAALIGYLPPFAQIQAALGPLGTQLAANQVRHLLFPAGQARWLERMETRLGCSGLIAIPWFADELATIPTDQLCQAIQQAIGQAQTLGARCVALAGMLPAHTRYGYALLETEQASPRPPLTTGHSTTVVAVVKSVLAVLAATGQTLATQEVSCLGLGSIGRAAIQLLLQRAGHPAALTLCDVKGSAQRLHALAATLRQEFDYQGRVRIIEVTGALPAEFYQTDLIIGATSQPNLLDVARLAPGTIVVDDSFPACFDVDQAMARMTTAADVLLIGGGLLHCGPIQRTVYLPLPSDALGA